MPTMVQMMVSEIGGQIFLAARTGAERRFQIKEVKIDDCLRSWE